MIAYANGANYINNQTQKPHFLFIGQNMDPSTATSPLLRSLSGPIWSLEVILDLVNARPDVTSRDHIVSSRYRNIVNISMDGHFVIMDRP